MNWYLIQTKPRAYLSAFEHLQQQGFHVFLPLLAQTTRKNGKFLDKTAPLFPGYLFMGTLLDPIPWKSINGTRGVSKAVTLDGKYRPVNIDIIKGLKNRCNEKGIIQKTNEIIPGDRVRIERGPFADFICNVDVINDERRVWLLINLLQQKIKAEFSIDELTKVD